jgi:predicted amidohydrolase
MTPSPELHITLLQANQVWENPTANLDKFEKELSKAGKTDLIVLPEMFSTGFSMNPKQLAEPMNGASMNWMHQQALKHQAVVTGSLIITEKGKFFNRLIWMNPDGSFHHYDKRHLFSFANEQEHYAAGNDRLIVALKGWRICPLICYDLRFPVWSRNLVMNGDAKTIAYDLLIYVANWPEARSSAWMNLLEARAHENQTYVAGLNRVGNDGNGIYHSGNSMVIGPKGNTITSLKPGQEGILQSALSFEELETFRSKFTAWKDADGFQLLP